MARLAFAFFATVLALAGPASADSSQALVAPSDLYGEWRFDSLAQKNGRPVCTEQWSFAADGTLTVHSGEEVVTQTYRVERRDFTNPFDRKPYTNSVLLLSHVQSNRRPDCLGNVSPSADEPDRTNVVYKNVEGGIVFCSPMDNGALRLVAILRRTAPTASPSP